MAKNQNNNDMIYEYDKYVIASKTDLNGVITFCTKAFAQISGYSISELLGKTHKIVNHPDMPKTLFKEMWQTITKAKVWTGEIKNKKKDGTYYWVHATISPIFDDKKNIIAFSSVRKDITAQKDLEKLTKKLKEKVSIEKHKHIEKDKILAEKSHLASMGEMIDAIAHQWKTPLNIIQMNTSYNELMYETDQFNKESSYESFKSISSQVDHLVETLDEFRNFFRPNLNLEEVSLKDLVSSTMVLMNETLISYDITVDLSELENIYINMIPNEFKHLLINLINNSKDAFEENGIKNREIKFSSEKKGSLIELKVYDNAGGIPEDIINRIFESNFTTKVSDKGTGIGLYMSKQIVNKIGADISVKNYKNGACFIITFIQV